MIFKHLYNKTTCQISCELVKHFFKLSPGHVTSLIGQNVMTPYSEKYFTELMHTYAKFEENRPNGC